MIYDKFIKLKGGCVFLAKTLEHMNAIETKNLTKYYGKARGILNSNLIVEEGDIFGFIGPNGAGKSTTIRLLLGMIKPTEGKGYIYGKDCTTDGKSILKEIGYMPSEAQFYGQLKVESIIKIAADLHRKDCSETALRLCERFQIDTKKKIEDLSLGNRRKVSIVCAMQHNPRLLILDEPTSGLDPLMQKEFFAELKERNEKGATIFLSSHVLAEVQEHCKKAAIIKEGKLVVSGFVEELAKTNMKRVSIKGISKLPNLGLIVDVKQQNDEFNFLYKGHPKDLVSALNGVPFQDLSITDPSLEEIFMHFYEKEEI